AAGDRLAAGRLEPVRGAGVRRVELAHLLQRYPLLGRVVRDQLRGHVQLGRPGRLGHDHRHAFAVDQQRFGVPGLPVGVDEPVDHRGAVTTAQVHPPQRHRGPRLPATGYARGVVADVTDPQGLGLRVVLQALRVQRAADQERLLVDDLAVLVQEEDRQPGFEPEVLAVVDHDVLVTDGHHAGQLYQARVVDLADRLARHRLGDVERGRRVRGLRLRL